MTVVESIVAADSSSNDIIVVLMRSPEVSLGLALTDADDPADALQSWTLESEALLQTFRLARKSITLVDVELFFHHDAIGWSVLYNRLGVANGRAEQVVESFLRRPEVPHIVASRALLQLDSRARSVSQEMEAAILGPILGNGATESIMEFLQNWTQISAQVAILTEMTSWNETNGKLTDNSSESQRNFAWLIQRLAFVESDLHMRKSECFSLKSEVDVLHSRLKDLETEAQKLLDIERLGRETAEVKIFDEVERTKRFALKFEAAEASANQAENALAVVKNEAAALRIALADNQEASAALKAENDELSNLRKAMSADIVSRDQEISLLREMITKQCSMSEDLARSNSTNQDSIRSLRVQLGEHLLTKAKSLALEHQLSMSAEANRRVRGLLGLQLLGDARTFPAVLEAQRSLADMLEERDSAKKSFEELNTRLAKIIESMVEAKERLLALCASLEAGNTDDTRLIEDIRNILQSQYWEIIDASPTSPREFSVQASG